MDLDDLTERVKTEARRLGFDLVGVTTPDPPSHLEVYERWLAAGRHGEMTYLASERGRAARREPRQILPECESILVVGTNYLTAEAASSDAALAARVAAYALGEDYHDVLVKRLRRLVSFIEAEIGKAVPHRVYADTGPLLERELAQRAGLGWIGKNTCLIHPRKGSYLLLAEVLLGIPLHPDEPFAADRCGSCTRCVEACPTACIALDRTLDARRCISYLTIESKGEIPLDLRPAVGDWLFGCDICQQVCPWNVRFAEATSDPAFQPRAFLDPAQAVAFLELTPEGYREALRNSPLKRPKRRGLVRNAAVVAGNVGDSSAVAALTQVVLGDSEALARAHAAWALGEIGGAEAIEALRRARESERDAAALVEVARALAATGRNALDSSHQP